MAQTIQVRRGLAANLPAVLAAGELAYTTDTQKFYVGTGTGRVEINGIHELPDIGTPGTYYKVTTDSKGRVTSGTTSLSVSDISNAGTAATKNTGTSAGNVPLVGANGKLDTNILPATAITDTFVISTQAAMLALDAQVGDIAVRTDISTTYILQTADASVLEHWVELKTPADAVSSVNGKTGAVVINKSDVGLGNVDNTADANKTVAAAGKATNDVDGNPIKTTYAKIASPTFTGAPKAPTAAADTNTTQLATTAFVLAQGSSSAPAALAASAVVGSSNRYARADHAHPMPTLIDGGTF